MPMVTDQGIVTAELCEESKKYLSCLLVGKTGTNPNFLTWELLLTKKFNLNTFIGTCQQKISKEDIINKLFEIETNYLPERLKPYDPEIRKQQEELHHKKRALISSAIFVAITIVFPLIVPLVLPLALSLLGGGAAALTVAVFTYLLVGGPFLLYSITAFVAERIKDPEWISEYFCEESKWKEKISAMKHTQTEIIKAETEARISNKTMLNIQQIKPMLPNEAIKPLMVDAATTTPDAAHIIGKQSHRTQLFRLVKPVVNGAVQQTSQFRIG